MRIPSLFPYYILFLLMRSGAQLRIRAAAGGANAQLNRVKAVVMFLLILSGSFTTYSLNNLNF